MPQGAAHAVVCARFMPATTTAPTMRTGACWDGRVREGGGTLAESIANILDRYPLSPLKKGERVRVRGFGVLCRGPLAICPDPLILSFSPS